MGKRFKTLDGALKYLRSTSDDAGTTNPDAPAGSQLRLYQDYKSGKRTVEYTRAAGSKPGSLDSVVVKPFAFAAADTTLYIVPYSARVKSSLTATGLSLDTLGSSEELTNGIDAYGFIPAKVTVSVRSGTTTSTPDSKLTGKKYTKKGTTATYTLAFGRTTGNPSYSEQKAALLAAVTADANRGASFKPEVFR